AREFAVHHRAADPARPRRARRAVVHHQLDARHRVGGRAPRLAPTAAACVRPARCRLVGRDHKDALRATADRHLRGGAGVIVILQFAVGYATACVALAIVLCSLRLMRGPRAQDRVLALDTLWMCVMLMALMLGLQFG